MDYTNDEKYMKTELSHNEIALYKSEGYLFCFYDHLFLFLPYFILPINSPPFLSPITSSPLLVLLSPLVFISSGLSRR